MGFGRDGLDVFKSQRIRETSRLALRWQGYKASRPKSGIEYHCSGPRTTTILSDSKQERLVRSRRPIPDATDGVQKGPEYEKADDAESKLLWSKEWRFSTEDVTECRICEIWDPRGRR